MVELTASERQLLRILVRHRLDLYRNVRESVERVALETHPEDGVLGHVSPYVREVSRQEDQYENLLLKLSWN